MGISIPCQPESGTGGHFGWIVVSGHSKIGKNCNVSHGVTLGKASCEKRAWSPTLGDHAYIVSGAKIVGAVKVGDHVAIVANCVVTKDVPDNAVVVGIPGKVISLDGSASYVNRADYEGKV